MLVACWSTKGGVGVSVASAGIAAAHALRAGSSLLADLGGDQDRLHGLEPSDRAGIADWLAAGDDVPDDALGRLEAPLGAGASLLPRGTGSFAEHRSSALAEALVLDARAVVVDVGRQVEHGVGRAIVERADCSVLVTRACPLALARAGSFPVVPDAVIVVRDPRRALTWREIATRCGAPVVAELDVDPSVGAAVDAGLLARPLPRRFIAALGTVA